MSILSIVISSACLAATPEAGQSPAELRAAVHSALRRETTTKGPEHIVVVKELITLHQRLGANRQMVLAQRQQLQGQVAARLQRVGGQGQAANDDDYGPELVALIEKTIAPGTWESQGGLGRIYYWRSGRALAVSQTQDTHQDLADLLEQLHQ